MNNTSSYMLYDIFEDSIRRSMTKTYTHKIITNLFKKNTSNFNIHSPQIYFFNYSPNISTNKKKKWLLSLIFIGYMKSVRALVCCVIAYVFVYFHILWTKHKKCVRCLRFMALFFAFRFHHWQHEWQLTYKRAFSQNSHS